MTPCHCDPVPKCLGPRLSFSVGSELWRTFIFISFLAQVWRGRIPRSTRLIRWSSPAAFSTARMSPHADLPGQPAPWHRHAGQLSDDMLDECILLL